MRARLWMPGRPQSNVANRYGISGHPSIIQANRDDWNWPQNIMGVLELLFQTWISISQGPALISTDEHIRQIIWLEKFVRSISNQGTV